MGVTWMVRRLGIAFWVRLVRRSGFISSWPGTSRTSQNRKIETVAEKVRFRDAKRKFNF